MKSSKAKEKPSPRSRGSLATFSPKHFDDEHSSLVVPGNDGFHPQFLRTTANKCSIYPAVGTIIHTMNHGDAYHGSWHVTISGIINLYHESYHKAIEKAMIAWYGASAKERAYAANHDRMNSPRTIPSVEEFEWSKLHATDGWGNGSTVCYNLSASTYSSPAFSAKVGCVLWNDPLQVYTSFFGLLAGPSHHDEHECIRLAQQAWSKFRPVSRMMAYEGARNAEFYPTSDDQVRMLVPMVRLA